MPVSADRSTPVGATASRHVTARLLDPDAVRPFARRGQRAPARLNWRVTRTTAAGCGEIEENMSDDANAIGQANEFKAWACHPDMRLLPGSMGGTIDR
jgi:hypothetical protein